MRVVALDLDAAAVQVAAASADIAGGPPPPAVVTIGADPTGSALKTYYAAALAFRAALATELAELSKDLSTSSDSYTVTDANGASGVKRTV